MVGLDFEVMPSKYEEPSHSSHLSDPEEFATEVTIGKGMEVFNRIGGEKIALSADTIGILGDEVLEKPRDREDAKRMLELMSGKEHKVLTVVALFSPGQPDPSVESVWTSVFFRELEEAEIDSYLDIAVYQDKAAAYAIQGEASIFVEKIEGDFFNVMGLPIMRVWQMLKNVCE